MKENLYQLIKEREMHFPEGTIRNIMFQVIYLDFCFFNGIVVVVKMVFGTVLGFEWISIHASTWVLPSRSKARKFTMLWT